MIDNKYVSLTINASYLETPPKIYIDFFILKSNLKKHWKSYNTFQFEVGLFGKSITGNIFWGFVERERTEAEEDERQRVKKLINELQ